MDLKHWKQFVCMHFQTLCALAIDTECHRNASKFGEKNALYQIGPNSETYNLTCNIDNSDLRQFKAVALSTLIISLWFN